MNHGLFLVSIILAVMTLNNDYIKKNYIKKIISKMPNR
ncbi:hypothetical protein E9M_04586 [Moraxella catarrhalis 46P47B1]|uniref:Uncharacterized protein n=1 Tax=Moraxella catarrhalis TaxID=480 RepID=A0A3Q9GGF8_MORCA|nr:hypothetical protein EJK52_1544 [Moraxella catarrhalis]EGE12744.1 hypothetical protein E9G_00173 [Moraxella catarrhalis 7169]EGE13089.1 hypothetical protein E9M_04586 [Moraxella catarrhalis 46P47B1]EGE13466.1 hypothetical protein E9O_09109 [Moraxella catarrhalis 12P80B1]EGE19195.1 hypothetical protein E9Q_02313 [Moraxella catarrhalis BC1]EGE21343.1 hypothetical protein E9U_02521 [Moraxella catarrhalis BC8]EGE22958.1 hypothetical protein E9W_07720 [Moraxella catarrhalis CO72]EGE24717.1 hyp